MLADIYRRNNLNVSIVSEADENAAIIAMVHAGLGCGVMPRSEEVSRSAFGAIPIRDSGFDTRIRGEILDVVGFAKITDELDKIRSSDL